MRVLDNLLADLGLILHTKNLLKESWISNFNFWFYAGDTFVSSMELNSILFELVILTDIVQGSMCDPGFASFKVKVLKSLLYEIWSM